MHKNRALKALAFIPALAAFFQVAPGKPDLFKFKSWVRVQWGREGRGRLRLRSSQQLPPKDKWQVVVKMTSSLAVCPLLSCQ